MANAQLFGLITQIGEIETFGQNGFRKRELLIETVEEYPNNYKIEFHQVKTELLDKFSIGDSVKVSISIRGRKYVKEDGSEEVFNSIVGWKIENLRSDRPNSAVDQYQSSQNNQPSNTEEEQSGEVPF